MKCEHTWRQSYRSYENGIHITTTLYCDKCKKFKEIVGTHEERSMKRLDETDKRLNQAVIAGKTNNKSINKLRSYMKNGKWNYKYL